MPRLPLCDRSAAAAPDRMFSVSWWRGLHRDESGVINLLTVFVMLGCTWVLLWLLNSARQLDSKVRMQNAADAGGQSGVGILARGMNSIAFANQLEADLLAAVAVMQAADSMTTVSSSLADTLLPAFQAILEGTAGQLPPDRPIPAFRNDVVRRIPLLADEVTRNVSRANGRWRGPDAGNNPDGPQGPLLVQLWTTTGYAAGYTPESDPRTRTLPVIDPTPSGPDFPFLTHPDRLLAESRRERERLVRHYVWIWARDLAAGDQVLEGEIVSRSERFLQFLLNDRYRDSNLPLILRSLSDDRSAMERDLMFVAVSYRRHPMPTAARMFRNPNASVAPAMAFSQVHLFLPHHRYVCCPWTEVRTDPRTGEPYHIVFTDGWPSDWSASTQNWQAKLVPATAPSISQILSMEAPGGNLNPAQYGRLTPRQLDELTHH